jgi:hypothetical protein
MPLDALLFDLENCAFYFALCLKAGAAIFAMVGFMALVDYFQWPKWLAQKK